MYDPGLETRTDLVFLGQDKKHMIDKSSLGPGPMGQYGTMCGHMDPYDVPKAWPIFHILWVTGPCGPGPLTSTYLSLLHISVSWNPNCIQFSGNRDPGRTRVPWWTKQTWVYTVLRIGPLSSIGVRNELGGLGGLGGSELTNWQRVDKLATG